MKNIFDYRDCFAEIENVPVIPVIESFDETLLFTFAIPTYNRPKTLDLTLQSILNQDSNVHYNIIICDNNPDRGDSTEHLIKDKYNSVPRLSYYKNTQNILPHGNWNRLVMLCKTKYMIMIHDDDVLFEQFLSNIHRLQKRFPDAAAINVRTQLWDGGVNVKKEVSNKKYRVIRDTEFTNFAFFCFKAPTGCLFKVKDLKETGGFNAIVGPSFDYTNLITMCLQKKKVLHYKKPLVLYRRVNNASSNVKVQYLQVDGDNLMREHLGTILHMPKWYVRFISWLRTSIRLRTINQKEPLVTYKGYKPAGSVFLVFYKLFYWAYMKVWVDRIHCISRM